MLLLIVFLICFGLLFSVVQNVLRKKLSGSSDYIHLAYSLDQNTTDVLFFGSSHAYYSVSANELWGEYGIPATVLASNSQPFCSSYYLLKDILKHQKPKAVVLETYAASFKKLYTEEIRMRQVLDAMPMSATKLEAIHDLCKDFSFGKKMAYLFPISFYHSRWKEMKPYDFIQPNTFLRGSYLTLDYRDYSQYRSLGKEVKKRKILDENLFYLQKIVDLTREQNIPLVLYASPIAAYKEDKYKAYYGANLAVEECAKEQDIPFLFLEKIEDLLGYTNEFMDSEHVSYFGQKKITSYLGEYLKEQYDLPDRREDGRYLSYQKDYEKYQMRLAEKLQDNPDGVYKGLPGQAVIEEDE